MYYKTSKGTFVHLDTVHDLLIGFDGGVSKLRELYPLTDDEINEVSDEACVKHCSCGLWYDEFEKCLCQWP